MDEWVDGCRRGRVRDCLEQRECHQKRMNKKGRRREKTDDGVSFHFGGERACSSCARTKAWESYYSCGIHIATLCRQTSAAKGKEIFPFLCVVDVFLLRYSRSIIYINCHYNNNCSYTWILQYISCRYVFSSSLIHIRMFAVWIVLLMLLMMLLWLNDAVSAGCRQCASPPIVHSSLGTEDSVSAGKLHVRREWGGAVGGCEVFTKNANLSRYLFVLLLHVKFIVYFPSR